MPSRPRAASEVAARLGERMGRPPGGVTRWRIEPSAALLLAAVAVALAAWFGWSALRPEPVAIAASVERPGEPWPEASPSPGSPESPSPTAAPTDLPAEVVVDVQGAVARPGVHRLPAGSRVVDAVAAAGGPVAGGAVPGLNLARILVDGEQLVVGPQPAGTAASGTQGGAATAAGGPPPRDAKVDLNRAELAELDGLPGVGPVLAQRIIDFRTKAGRFRSVEELREVSGIGERTYARLAPLVRV